MVERDSPPSPRGRQFWRRDNAAAPVPLRLQDPCRLARDTAAGSGHGILPHRTVAQGGPVGHDRRSTGTVDVLLDLDAPARCRTSGPLRRYRMSIESWENATSLRPPSDPCEHCGEATRKPVLARAGGGWDDRGVWRCSACGRPLARLAFGPTDIPDGRAEIQAAIDLIGVRVPVLARCDPAVVYEILRPYFKAGWCVRDVLRALDYQPDGQTQPGQGVAWSMRESEDRTLWRVRQRLRAWRWRDRPDEENIMGGWWTEMSKAMRVSAEEQRHRAAIRDDQWQLQHAAARTGDGLGRAMARRQARIAAGIAKRARHEADEREAARFAAEIAAGKAASAKWSTALSPARSDSAS